MRLFFDTSVLLNSPLKEPGSKESDECICLCGDGIHEGWIAWHSLSNIHYVVRSRTKSKTYATHTVTELLAWVEVAETTKSDAMKALSYGMGDYEDALQLAAAEACAADVLITRNTKDFKASSIPVMTPEEFLAAHGPPTAS